MSQLFAGRALDPGLVQFSHRSEDLDTEWQDAGAGRGTVVYTNLSAGSYSFSAAAKDGSDQWSGDEKTVELDVRPAWLHPTLFRAVLVVTMLGFIVLAYWLRVRWLVEKANTRDLARLGERVRIARELHDTLLQGTQALVAQVAAVSKEIAPSDPLRQRIDAALEMCTETLREARSRILDLRTSTCSGQGLSVEFSQRAAKLPREALEFELRVLGAERQVRPEVGEELCRLMMEAVRNAFKHAQASQVVLELAYGEDELCLRLRDNGVGMDPALIEKGKAGHWGLAGMRERACNLRAALTIHSNAKQGGTEVAVRIKGRRAYATPTRRVLPW